MNGPEVMFSLHPPQGGPARGYVCNADGICKDVTRTKRGMWAHLRVVHGIVKQAKLDFDQTIVPRPTPEADDALGVPRSWREKHPA